jgi:hypothetical protein
MEGRKWKMESGFARCQARGRTEAERADLRFEIGDYFRALRGAALWKQIAESRKWKVEIGKWKSENGNWICALARPAPSKLSGSQIPDLRVHHFRALSGAVNP